MAVATPTGPSGPCILASATRARPWASPGLRDASGGWQDTLPEQCDAEQLWNDRRAFTAGKQRLTAERLAELLTERDHKVSPRTVRRIVADLRRAEREVTVPLLHRPAELAQLDFFEVIVERAGVRIKAWMFLMRLLFSGRGFTMLCERQDATWFLAAHVAAFQHFAGVIAAVAHDNLTAAVAKVVLGEARHLRPRFAHMVAHYAFEARFCRVGEGHDKGSVERRGGNIRLQQLSRRTLRTHALRGPVRQVRRDPCCRRRRQDHPDVEPRRRRVGRGLERALQDPVVVRVGPAASGVHPSPRAPPASLHVTGPVVDRRTRLPALGAARLGPVRKSPPANPGSAEGALQKCPRVGPEARRQSPRSSKPTASAGRARFQRFLLGFYIVLGAWAGARSST